MPKFAKNLQLLLSQYQANFFWCCFSLFPCNYGNLSNLLGLYPSLLSNKALKYRCKRYAGKGNMNRKTIFVIAIANFFIIVTLCLMSFYLLIQAKHLKYRIAYLGLKLSLVSASVDCKVVNGNTHIYKGQCLPENYKPQTLAKLSPRASYLNTSQYLDIRAKKAVEGLIADAEKDGMCLVVSSGYRSEEEQDYIMRELAQTGEGDRIEYIALPGRSEHQTGLAIDFAACPMKDGKRDDKVERLELKNDFSTLPEYQWLLANAHKYNFEQSFREDNKQETGYPAEPWH